VEEGRAEDGEDEAEEKTAAADVFDQVGSSLLDGELDSDVTGTATPSLKSTSAPKIFFNRGFNSLSLEGEEEEEAVLLDGVFPRWTFKIRCEGTSSPNIFLRRGRCWSFLEDF